MVTVGQNVAAGVRRAGEHLLTPALEPWQLQLQALRTVHEHLRAADAGLHSPAGDARVEKGLGRPHYAFTAPKRATHTSRAAALGVGSSAAAGATASVACDSANNVVEEHELGAR